MAEPVTITLSQPIEAHGERLTALSLRAPTGKDLRTAGLPYKLTADGAIAIEAANMHRMIAALAAVPPSTVDALSAADWNDAAMAVLGFITPAPATEPAPKKADDPKA